MHARIPPRGLRVAVGGVLLVLMGAGCASTTTPSGVPVYRMSATEQAQAQAIAHYVEGLLQEEAGGVRAEAALSHFLQAAELDPGHHRLYAKAATGLLLNDHAEEALALLQRSCTTIPDSVLAWVDLATAYQFLGRFDEAIGAFRTALKLDPHRSALYVAIAAVQFQQKRDREALATLAEGLPLADEPQGLRGFAYRRGLQFIEERESQRSLPCFEFVVQYADDHQAQIYYLMGQLYEGLGLVNEAQESYALAAEEEPPVSQAFIKLAILQFEDDPEKALMILDQAQTRLPDDFLIPFAKGQMLSSQGRYREAIPAFSSVARILERTPDTDLPSSFYLHYGAAYERSGDFPRAAQVFEECLRRYPNADDVQNYLAYMWAEQNIRLNEALDLIKRALKAEPQNGAYLDTLGWVYYRLGRYEEAAAIIEQALRHMPGDPTVHEHLGDVCIALGNRELALRHWTDSYIQDLANLRIAEKLRAHGIDTDALARDAAGKAVGPVRP